MGTTFLPDGSEIKTKTEIGEVTARILGFNILERLLEGEALITVENYPSLAAQFRMKNSRE
jgi:hypothetical protein